MEGNLTQIATESFDSEFGIAARWARFRRSRLVCEWTRSPVGMAGTIMVAIVLLAALVAPVVSPHDPTQHHRDIRFLPPMWSAEGRAAFPLGTDQLGRDVLSRLLVGSRISVLVGVTSVVIGGTIGAVLGISAGYWGGFVDLVVSRFIDAFLAVPFIVLVLALVGVLGPSLLTIIIVLGTTGWASYARVVRGEVLSLKEREFVLAAKALGASEIRIAVRHVLPNTFASIIVLATLSVASTILAEASLSYLGLGVQPPTVTWGLMISNGRQYLSSAWWLATFPGVSIMITVLGVIFLGDWLRDVLDPRLKGAE